MAIITNIEKFIETLEKQKNKLKEETTVLSLKIQQQKNRLKDLKAKQKLDK